MKIKLNLNISLLTICFCLFYVNQSKAQCHIDDWTALKAIYESTNGDNWGYNAGWEDLIKNQAVPPMSCNLNALRGVNLNESGRVVHLALRSNNLTGIIPPEIGHLSQLDSLDLRFNNLSGNIPKEIGNLSELRFLSFNANNLTGNIPSEIGGLSQLTSLELSSNILTGSIPPEIGNLSSLNFLSLFSNELTGNIPTEMGNLSRLHTLQLFFNNLTGNIPPSLGNLTNLSTLSMSGNQLTGSIPLEFEHLENLFALYLSNNLLTGDIPDVFGNLSKLAIVFLQNNTLTGSIPGGFGLLNKLIRLELDSNQLSGCYHPDLAKICNRKYFIFSNDWDNFDASWENFCESGQGVCQMEEEVIFACTDSIACNYNPNANYENNTCTYYDPLVNCPCDQVTGCMDPYAANYNPLANCDNGFCEYENNLLPGTYSYDYCWNNPVKVNLAKTCPSGIFEIVGNTSGNSASIDENGLLTINNNSNNIAGAIKIRLIDFQHLCISEWIINVYQRSNFDCGKPDLDDLIVGYYPWLSHLVNPSNCNNNAVVFYPRFVEYDIVEGHYIYVINSNGGVLYSPDGKFVCTDYENGESTCAERYNLGSVDETWVCDNNTQIQGCADVDACNYLPEAVIPDESCKYYNCTNPLQYVKCPENIETAVCAPVSVPTPLNLQYFVTTDDANVLSELSIQVEEQTNIQKYFATTTYNYTIMDEVGDQKTCQSKYHIANQFLQAPEVSPPGVVCEEDLWSAVKIGTDQYKIYSDDNGTKGEELSTCNTLSLICSTGEFGVDTNIPNQYNFLTTTYFTFPDGTICESEASPFFVDVQSKPVAVLNEENKKLNPDEGIALMDLVNTNKSGYWTGENVVYLITASGDNIAYFTANKIGNYKMYYTVRNNYCERSYLLLLRVGNSLAKPLATQQAQKKVSIFNIYPNPASNKIFINLPFETVCQITLTNISGKVVKQFETNVDESIIEMNVADLPKGMYLMELNNTSNQMMQKLIIE